MKAYSSYMHAILYDSFGNFCLVPSVTGVKPIQNVIIRKIKNVTYLCSASLACSVTFLCLKYHLV